MRPEKTQKRLGEKRRKARGKPSSGKKESAAGHSQPKSNQREKSTLTKWTATVIHWDELLILKQRQKPKACPGLISQLNTYPRNQYKEAH